ncbi:hypothetical protein [Halopelagius fulvigenes]|uniref:Uncharacterized protein n=1 Tax=Halopelagius fulvigenes TaxID=1198324 RepID=A0ABD5U1L4_9EURY
MRKTKPIVTLLAVVLLAAAVVPAAVSAAPTVETDVEQDPDTGTAVVTVVQNGTAVENATVEVTTEGNYSGTGNYTTDANGTVALPEPNETVAVNLTVTVDGESATSSAELYPREDSLDTYVEQAEDGTATVTVTQYGDVVENASVEVSADGNYSETGNYTTDANGTVSLSQPEETQNVTVTATYDGLDAEFTTELAGAASELAVSVERGSDGATVEVTRNDTAVENATVEVSADGNYSGAGTYRTDADGEVALPAPTENVTVTVTASSEGDEATDTATLTTEYVAEQKNFGQSVTRFIEALRAAGFNGPPGQIISDFVTSNNPGNADDAPGHEKKNDAAANESKDDERGPPEKAQKKGKEKGDDEKKGNGKKGNAKDDKEDDSDDSGSDDGGNRGPPDHAKGGR